jgi:EAL domain-containing protein (putative c-di-GMP-specific phosphodiesterase class I)/DNA-binding NarL/FixJ family response regulator
VSATDLARLQVLVVDDLKTVRSMTRALLLERGFGHVETCDDGVPALAFLDRLAAEDGRCDLILLDLNMPGMDGIEVLRHLADRGFAGHVALFSAESARVLRTAEALAGAHNLNLIGVVPKPLTADAIETLLTHMNRGVAPPPAPQDAPPSEMELLDGIRRGQIEVMVQPKVSFATGRPVGAEALARWRHPERGLLGAGRFVPLAENGAAAEPLFDATLAAALRIAGQWRRDHLDLQMAVNLSTANLTRLDLPQRIAMAVAEAGLGPDAVVLEVTESRLIHDLAAALEVLTRLRLKGFRLAIDDFGTGYSSLEQLQRIPFEEMKIDRRFVGPAAHDPAARAIVSSSIGLARKLGMITVAEGIETRAAWDCAAGLGCDIAQGYFIAEPLPPGDFAAWLTDWSRRQP